MQQFKVNSLHDRNHRHYEPGDIIEISDDEMPAKGWIPHGPGPHKEWVPSPPPAMTDVEKDAVLWAMRGNTISEWGKRGHAVKKSKLVESDREEYLVVGSGDVVKARPINLKEYQDKYTWLPPIEKKMNSEDSYQIVDDVLYVNGFELTSAEGNSMGFVTYSELKEKYHILQEKTK